MLIKLALSPIDFYFFIVRRLMNIMYHGYRKGSKEAALCLDAEKAFDQVEWAYMMKVLEEFGFGSQYVSWITILYAHPSSFVLTNQERSALSHYAGHAKAVPSARCSLPLLLSLSPLVLGTTLLLNPSNWGMWIITFHYTQMTLFSSYHNLSSLFQFC